MTPCPLPKEEAQELRQARKKERKRANALQLLGASQLPNLPHPCKSDDQKLGDPAMSVLSGAVWGDTVRCNSDTPVQHAAE